MKFARQVSCLILLYQEIIHDEGIQAEINLRFFHHFL